MRKYIGFGLLVLIVFFAASYSFYLLYVTFLPFESNSIRLCVKEEKDQTKRLKHGYTRGSIAVFSHEGIDNSISKIGLLLKRNDLKSEFIGEGVFNVFVPHRQELKWICKLKEQDSRIDAMVWPYLSID